MEWCKNCGCGFCYIDNELVCSGCGMPHEEVAATGGEDIGIGVGGSLVSAPVAAPAPSEPAPARSRKSR
jgi:hypothetical protein